MRKALSLALVAAFTLAIAASGPATATPVEKKEKKVSVCHVPPGNPANGHVIRVSSSALPAHLGHGDCGTYLSTGGGSCKCRRKIIK